MAETTTTDAIETKKVTDLEEKTTPEDDDLFMAGDAGESKLKKIKWSNLLEAVKAKIAKWTFETLSTEDKTVPGALNELNSNIGALGSLKTSIKTSIVGAINALATIVDGKAKTNHASTANTYGLGTTSNYGHVKTINGLGQTNHADGTALSAYQGYVLDNAKAATGAGEFASLATFIDYVGKRPKQTYIGKWKDTGGWGPRGASSWYHGFCVLQNAPGGTSGIDGFIVCQSSTNYYIGYVTGTTTAAVTWHKLVMPNNNGDFGELPFANAGMISGTTPQLLQLWASAEADYVLCHGVRNGAWGLSPFKNGSLQLGAANYKWGQVYSNVASISTSDRNEKHDIRDLPANIKDFVMGLSPVAYKLNDGTSGRLHYGLIAQDVELLMESCGMTSADFAGFVKSPKTDPVFGEGGEIIGEKNVEGEYIYGLRYDEFIAPLIKMVQIQQKEIEELKTLIEKSTGM